MIATLKRALKRTPLYPMYAYLREQRALREQVRAFRQWTKDDDLKMAFYGQLIRPGNLVFDVGANMGNRSKIFLRLGAKVVAFEPQSKGCAILARRFQAS